MLKTTKKIQERRKLQKTILHKVSKLVLLTYSAFNFVYTNPNPIYVIGLFSARIPLCDTTKHLQSTWDVNEINSIQDSVTDKSTG